VGAALAAREGGKRICSSVGGDGGVKRARLRSRAPAHGFALFLTDAGRTAVLESLAMIQRMDEKQKEELKKFEAQERSSPSGEVVYKAILSEADDELKRPSTELFWSGLAAGLSMGFSLLAESLLRHHLPDAHWRPLVAKAGYSVGFIIVILGRQQLFTENTLTPVLPVLRHKDAKTLTNMLRLWGVVLIANLIGALAFALAMMKTAAFSGDVKQTAILIGHDAMNYGFGVQVIKGIFAGWLVALIVWLLPFAESARLWVIIIITWLIGVAGFSHIIAGAVEVFALAWAGAKSWGVVIGGYVIPVLIGNIIGGVTLVAAINHAQVGAGGKKDAE
jgi:formate/nitrite transporter FocA (FNT family)